MGNVLTGDEVLNEAINAMGSPLGGVYQALGDEVAWLHLKWNDFRELFADSDLVDVLNSAAPAFFHDLQRQSWEDLLMHLCRVTDRTKTFGKENLTIRLLPDLVTSQKLKDELEPLIQDVCDATDFARDWRNRRGAHEELRVGRNVTPLASAKFDYIDTALTAIRTVLNRLEQHYLNKTVSYEDTIPALGGVQSLIAIVRKGVETRRSERDAKLRKYGVVAK
jgi:HEPN superfamily AbiU2-like protein